MYNAQITRKNKGAIMILIDRSGSMEEEVYFEGRTMTKAQALCDAVNALITEIINRSHRERYVGDYFDLAIIGYAGDKAESLLGSGFKRIVDVSTIDTPVRIIRRTRRLPSGKQFDTLIERREWITPFAKGRTPMGEALKKARRMCAAWCRKHPDSFPPIVINITDGEATDASPDQLRTLASKLRSVSTNDGNVLLVNIHLACQYDTPSPAVRFPSENTPLPVNRHSQLLYDISSTLPSLYNNAIISMQGGVPPFRAICYNSPISELVSLLAIGSLGIDQLI
ncbi:MAG: VWA domain-containing protein [Tidjanibacter sp.]|nr:VWA domain-containing protein [Tidjanibacter sp.]